ncbi:MAG: IS110 family transposase [Bacteroidetes bacterium GWF2_41_31]|nr:MAG: IS110 family transposase [Bacteroidetes bacterium GWF2_41_31]
MDKNNTFFGIDISKDVFDVMDPEENHYQFENNVKGFRKFSRLLNLQTTCVMEAAGYYHLQLAYFLVEKHFKVSIVNPLSVKRFIQMKLSKIKTDKFDARMIRLYAQGNEVKLWQGQSKNQIEALQIARLQEQYTKQSTALKNKIHGEKTLGNPCNIVSNSLKKSLMQIKKEQAKLDERLVDLVRVENRQLLTNLESIPGMGRKTATMLVIQTDGFKRFDSAAALCSYCGTTPIIRKSGSSVNGRSRISKMGNQKLRNLLFLCSFTASIHNKACRDIYNRIVNKGKSKKLALIAVSNKLLKQSFAIAQSGIPYDENYKSVLIMA